MRTERVTRNSSEKVADRIIRYEKKLRRPVPPNDEDPLPPLAGTAIPSRTEPAALVSGTRHLAVSCCCNGG